MANTLVQSPTATAIIGGTTVGLAFASGGTNPSTYVASVTVENPWTVSSLSDDRNGSYGAADVSVDSGSVGSGSGISAFYSVTNISTSIATVTLTISATGYAVLDTFEITSPGGAPTLDSTGSGSGDGTAKTATCTTIAENCSVFANGTMYPGAGSEDAGYTPMYGAPTNLGWVAYHFGEYDVDVGSAGAQTLNFEEPSTADGWSLAIAAYKPAEITVTGNRVSGPRIRPRAFAPGVDR